MTSPNRSGLPGSSYDDSSDSADPLQPLTEAAMSHGEIKGILPQVLLRIRDAFRADTAVLLLADDAGKNLTVSAVVGALEQELTPGVPARLVPAKIALRNLDTLSVSLVVDSRLVGELHIGNLESHRFTAVQTKQLQGLADRLALTLDQNTGDLGVPDEKVVRPL